MIIIAGLWYQTQQWMKSYSCICSNMYLQTYTSFVSDSNAALCVYIFQISCMHPDCVIQLEKEKCMERMEMDDPVSEPELSKNHIHTVVLGHSGGQEDLP